MTPKRTFFLSRPSLTFCIVHPLQCIVQCAMMETGGFVNNALNTDAIKRSMASTLGADPNFGSLVNGAVDTCARQIQNDPAYSVAPISSSPDRAGCSFIPQGFVNCLYTALFKVSWSVSREAKKMCERYSY